MVSVGTFLFLGVATAVLFITSRFGEGFGRGAEGIGSGLGTLGEGIQRFVSRVSSPTITPFVRPTVDFSRVLPGLQAGLGEAGRVIQGRDPVGTGGSEGVNAGVSDTVVTPFNREQSDYEFGSF